MNEAGATAVYPAIGHASHRDPAAARTFSVACPAVLVPVVVAGFWPVWRWYAARMTDGSDDPLGLVALVTVLAFLPRSGWRRSLSRRALLAAAVILAVHVLTFGYTPPLVRGGFAVMALACILPPDAARSPLPRFALLLLSLPVIASLQFYLGFPLRAATAWCAAQVLGVFGYAVEAHGTVLAWAGEEILVDAPCSGIRMLWTASYLSATLAALHRLPGWRVVRLAQLTAAAVFLANLARTVMLFFLETGFWPNPPWAHEAAGLALFVVAAGTCAGAARWLRPRPEALPERA